MALTTGARKSEILQLTWDAIDFDHRMKKTRSLTKAKTSKPSAKKRDLLEDLRNMIDQAKRSVASVINTQLIALNWQMGRRKNMGMAL